MKYDNKRISLTEDAKGDIDEMSNFIDYEKQLFYLRYIDPIYKSSKGASSSVFVLYDINGYHQERIIKISNYFETSRSTPKFIRRRYGRFMNEIAALYSTKEKDLNGIVTIDFDGMVTIDGRSFPYYVMEKGDTDLKEYLLNNLSIDNQERMGLCLHIYSAINQLHSMDIYHRDIKPDNVFLFNKDEDEVERESDDNKFWKIGDLGLIAERDKDDDDIGERIGPFGWVSPEAMNKYLTEKADVGFDCKIDDKSDIFQLGKLFWFIFQCNVPIGQILSEDFRCDDKNKDNVFELIKEMLQYSKDRRIELNELGNRLYEIAFAYGI